MSVALIVPKNLQKDPSLANFEYLRLEVAPVRRYLDGKDPKWPKLINADLVKGNIDQISRLAAYGVPSDVERILLAYSNSGAFKLPAQGALLKTNLIPAALRYWNIGWVLPDMTADRTGASRLYFVAPENQLAANTAAWVADRQTLLWDTEGGNATVKALARPLVGDVKDTYPSPYWLVSSMEALVSGESHILKRNEETINRVIEAVTTWAPEGTWFRYTPTKNDRDAMASMLNKLKGKLTQAAAVSAQQIAQFNAVLAAAQDPSNSGVPYIAPPKDGLAWYYKLAIAGVVGGLGYAAYQKYATPAEL